MVTGGSEKDKRRKLREQKRSCFHRHVEDVSRNDSTKRKKSAFIDLTPVQLYNKHTVRYLNRKISCNENMQLFKNSLDEKKFLFRLLY